MSEVFTIGSRQSSAKTGHCENVLETAQKNDWNVEVDRVAAREWSDLLDLFDDANIYQTGAYGGVRWGEKNLSRIVLKRDGEVVAAAQLRIIRPTPLKFGIAYLRWGPLLQRRGHALDAEVAGQMASALENEYLKKRKLFLRILPNAFEGSPRAAIVRSAFARFAAEPFDKNNLYRTFVLDLTPPLEELRSRLDRKWRNQLTRAEKNSLRVVAGTEGDFFETFCQMYREMRKRKTFDTTVDIEEFRRMQQVLTAKHRMQVLICEEHGVPVAGLVASAMGTSAIYILGATSDRGLNSKGAYLLQWTLITSLKENGVKSYDLGGIDPEGNPGVFHFKQGFSGADVYQMSPLAAAEGAVSSQIIKAGLAIWQALHMASSPSRFARSLKQLTARN